MRLVVAFLLFVSFAAAQPVLQNRMTFSGGWSRQVGGYSLPKETATGLGLSYGYRIRPHVEVEAGVFAAFQPSPDIQGAHYFLNPDDRFVWVPFGVRFIAPLYLGRIEFSGGGGGLYEKYSVSNPDTGFGLQSRDGWGGYFVASTALALDRAKHFWLGATPRLFLANPGYARDRWFQLAGEFSFRF
ncbi:MAG TPA: hypothetical protein VE959_28660 [Bryobacteraceae bacterium]|nr:hypothetical protein [Bryobacteraceae bacterium]